MTSGGKVMQKIQVQSILGSTDSVLNENRCYTVEDLMVILGVGRKAVYSLIREKAFPAIRINRVGYRIPRDSFHSWLYQQ